MDPATLMALIGGGSQAAGGLLSLPFNAYGDVEQLKLSRRGHRENERAGKFNRLLSLMQASNQGQNERAAENRLFKLRGGV